MILSRYSYDEMELNDLIKLLQPAKVVGRGDGVINGVAYDSRLVREGYVFVAIRGSALNGLDFMDDALARGAIAVVSESEIQLPATASFIQVKDARVALAQIACAFHRDPSALLDLVGITGTNGKTTISYLVHAALEADGRATGLIGTVENRIGDRVIPASRTTPEAPELQAMLDKMRAANCHAAVMEVSSHALDQHRVDGIEFDVAVFTNLTQDHLDYHADFENYFAAKARLFEEGRSQHAVVNLDDDYGMRLAEEVGVSGQLITYGFHPDAMVRAEELRMDATGSTFNVSTPWGDSDMRLQLLGRYNVSNALAAIAATCALGVSLARVIDALEQVTAVPGRLEPIASDCGKVFVDYAHTDDALENVLTTLREITPGKLHVVFGCGGDRDRQKRSKMAAVAERLADFAFVTSDNPRREDPMAIIDEICTGFTRNDRYRVEPDREAAIAAAIEVVGADDVLLIAGKGHENYQELANSVVPFDDREVARNLISQRNC